jgi:hypothetical protein
MMMMIMGLMVINQENAVELPLKRTYYRLCLIEKKVKVPLKLNKSVSYLRFNCRMRNFLEYLKLTVFFTFKFLLTVELEDGAD